MLADTTKVTAADEPRKTTKVPVELIAKITADIAGVDGWIHLSVLGTNITKL